MVKKPTLIVLLCAIVLGGAVYYFDWKKGNDKKSTTDDSKPAFSLQAADITSFTLAHPSQPGDVPIRFEKRNGVWRIVQPVETEADQSTAEGIVDQLASARISQSEPGTPDRRKAYGLDTPQAAIEFQVASGAKHSVVIGDKDFSGENVYAVVDGGQSASVLPDLLLTSAGKSLDDLRDRSLLHYDAAQVTSVDLKNSAGDFAMSKDKNKNDWKFAVPANAPASAEAVDLLLETVANSKMVSVAGEKPDNLARYGLAAPAITFTAADPSGTKATLAVGKKDGDAYFARDLSRSAIFRINSDVYKDLSYKFSDLRDKQVVHLAAADTQRIQIQTAGGAAVLSRKKPDSDDWTFESPSDQKGKSATSWKILDPLGSARADEVIDHPAAALLAPLSNPAIRLVLTDTNGKELTVRISKPVGDFVYAQTSDGPELYKLKKQVFGDLNLKPADLVAGETAPS